MVDPARGARRLPGDGRDGARDAQRAVRLPPADVSRLFLLVLFPVQAAATIASRACSAWCMERQRRQRPEPALRARPRRRPACAGVRAKLEDHRELGLRIAGSSTTPSDVRAAGRWPLPRPARRPRDVLHTQVVDEVAICLPFSQWDLIDAIAQLCEEEGKIVRIPMDVLDRAVSVGRVEELDGTPVFSLVSGPDRALALAIKRLVDIVGVGLGIVLLSPLLLGIAVAIRLDDGRPILFRQRRVGLHGRPFDVVKFRSMRPTPRRASPSSTT